MNNRCLVDGQGRLYITDGSHFVEITNEELKKLIAKFYKLENWL